MPSRQGCPRPRFFPLFPELLNVGGAGLIMMTGGIYRTPVRPTMPVREAIIIWIVMVTGIGAPVTVASARWGLDTHEK